MGLAPLVFELLPKNYAAMITRMDRDVGRLMKLLKKKLNLKKRSRKKNQQRLQIESLRK